MSKMAKFKTVLINMITWRNRDRYPALEHVEVVPEKIVYDTKIINIFGGPGIGKSTVATRLFSEMKMLGKEVELVSEYAKDMVWENRTNILHDQLYIFAKQHRRLQRLMGKVEYIVTDSPILLGIEYMADDYFKTLKPLILEAHESLNSVNFMLNRQTAYNTVGRNQDEAGAIELDNALIALLNDNGYSFDCIDTKDENAHQLILNKLEIK